MHFYRFDPNKRLYFNPVMHRYTERWQGYGLVNSYDYDLIVIGSSVARYPLKDVEKTYNKKSICVSMSGANFYETSLVVNFSKAQNVVWVCLQEFLQNENIEGDFPLLFYKNSFLKHFSYLLKIDVFFTSLINCYDKINHKMPKANVYDFRYNLYANSSKKKLLEFYEKEIKKNYRINPKQQIKMFEKHIVNTIKNNDKKKFDIIIPPCTILFYKMLLQKGEFKNYLFVRKYMIEQLMLLKNIRIFDMESDISLTKNFDCFSDWWHHNDFIYKKILNYIKIKKNLITNKNIKSHNQSFKQTVENFQISEIMQVS